VPLTGRKQVPWSTLLPRRVREPEAAPAAAGASPTPAMAGAAGPVTHSESATLAGTMTDQNGT